ncbi:hypothetical protein KEM48_014465 [Puccinia striiformis f. sp. tritici PST-130]|nr:hypothetical protein KEM48_014465 [Puccinia striiformis f. sp. tritici PST-130]
MSKLSQPLGLKRAPGFWAHKHIPLSKTTSQQRRLLPATTAPQVPVEKADNFIPFGPLRQVTELSHDSRPRSGPDQPYRFICSFADERSEVHTYKEVA